MGSLKEYAPLDPCVKIHGRTVKCAPLPLFWTASGIELETDATELNLVLSSNYEASEQWIRVELDGATILRRPLEKGRNTVQVFRGFGSGCKHRVRLYKEVQPMPRDPLSTMLVEKIVCDGQLFALPDAPHRIEVIGDSVSAGEGLAGPRSLTDGPSLVFSTQGHYALELARKLNADCRILAQSGWGVAAGWDNDPTHAMPLYYEQICGVVQGLFSAHYGGYQPADFAGWQPDAVIVHLGNNDAFALDSPPWQDPATGKEFKLTGDANGRCTSETLQLVSRAVKNFLITLRRCNPHAQLIWAYGMFGEKLRPAIELGIEQYKQRCGDTAVQYVPLPFAAPSDYGSNNHPGTHCHHRVAASLAKAIAPLFEV